VVFTTGDITLGSASLGNGTATFTTTALPLGPDTVIASYGGDPDYSPVGAVISQRVMTAPTVTLVGTPNPSVLGQTVVLTTTVNAPAAGLPVPTGTVSFSSNGNILGSGILGSGILAPNGLSFPTPVLPLGSDTVTVSYSGDANYNPASTFLTQRVFANPVLTLVSSANPSPVGRPLVFAVGVAAPAGLQPPTGNVTFSSGGRTIGFAPIIGGTATLTTIELPIGQDTVTASYGGDGDYNPGSTSLAEHVVPTAGPGVFDPNTGTWFQRDSAAANVNSFAYGAPGWTPVAGDWDGNHTDTAGMVDPAAVWYLRNGNSPGAPAATPFAYGFSSWIPVVGDWNGTGHTGIGMFDPSTATWYLRNEDGPGAADAGAFRFGAPGWIPVVGDWNGDGKTTVGVVDPSTGTWYLRNRNSAGPADSVFAFGLPGWAPVAGDWGGTGHAGVGMFDPTTATWYLRNEANGGPADAAAPFAFGGTINPIPVPLEGGWGPFQTVTQTFTPAWKPVVGTWDVPLFEQPLSGQLPLLAAGGPAGVAAAAPLQAGQLQAAVSGALGRLAADGVGPAVLARLAAAHYQLAALGGGELGLADPAADAVRIDAGAAGYGWFVDPTPLRDEEFHVGAAGSPLTALPGTAAAGRMDLLTVVLHEMGHLAGRPDLDAGAHPGDLMADTLAPGTRRTDAIDQVFKGGGL
jgi:hypothetical protein